MLQTQINYWTLQETKRHNFATEGLQQESNALVREQNQIGWFTAKETQRHNQQQEGVGWTNANENIRHNKQSENIGYANINLGYAQLAETTRHNVQQEGIGWANAAANITSANAARQNALTNTYRYGLDVVKLPSEIMKNIAAANSSNASANYSNKKAGAVKHEVIQGYGNMVGNLLKGAGSLIGSLKPQKKR